MKRRAVVALDIQVMYTNELGDAVRLLLLRAGSVISSTTLGLLLSMVHDDSPAWWPQLFEDYVGVPWLVGLVAVSIITWNGVVDSAAFRISRVPNGLPDPVSRRTLIITAGVDRAGAEGPLTRGIWRTSLLGLRCCSFSCPRRRYGQRRKCHRLLPHSGELRFGSTLVSALGAAAPDRPAPCCSLRSRFGLGRQHL